MAVYRRMLKKINFVIIQNYNNKRFSLDMFKSILKMHAVVNVKKAKQKLGLI